MNQKEKLFFDKLKNIFIGAKIEGDSGFINLMRIKSSYFNIIFKELVKKIDEDTKDCLEFKEEMFDKLFTFFKTYFSDSGSIYFRYTPLKSKVYEEVYSNNKDVMLFWKTHMLYYVKTDKLWNNLTVDFDEDEVNYKVHFDVSKLQHKNSNEKKEIIYELKSIKGKEITFNIFYSERGRKTKIDNILKEFKKKNIHLDEVRLSRILGIFEKQNEVDYFINQNAGTFLKEQFDLWLKNYIFDDESDFSEKRLKQLKILKEIAYKVIDFVAQFEDELVKIWNKPKFVLNSNYVITLDRIPDVKLIEKIIKHKGFGEQVKEWKELGIIKEFDKKKLFTNTLNGNFLSKEYEMLPIDTKYFDEDIKLEILSLFDDLDNKLDGWLIHSENYQALKTILPKFQGRVQTCYIDPPFNTGHDFDYVDKFQDSTWLTLIENRISLVRNILSKNGSIFLHLDYNADFFGRVLMNTIFGSENYLNTIVWHFMTYQGQVKEYYPKKHNNILWYKKENRPPFQINYSKEFKHTVDYKRWKDFIVNENEIRGDNYPSSDSRFMAYYDKWVKENGRNPTKDDIIMKFKGYVIDDVWMDIQAIDPKSKNERFGFLTQKPEALLKRLIKDTNQDDKREIIIDFFSGIGTTVATAHKLNKRWIGIEMGDHFGTFYMDKDKEIKTGISGRMKEILAGRGNHEPTPTSEDLNWKGGGFFKYYNLEQYEQTLKRAVYKESNPFIDFKDKSIYQQYVFMKDLKLLDAMKLDSKKNKIEIDFSKIYSNIDLAETISNIKGKQIKKIEKNAVTLEGNEKIEFDKIDFNLVKPMIWW